MGEYLRRGASSFRAEDEERLLEGMIAQMQKTTAQANAAIDAALAEVEASNRRIAGMEARRRKAA
jgi:phage shock protein A